MYQLSNSLPHLVARVGIRMGCLFLRVIRKVGLTLPMYRVLAVLAEQEMPLRLVELSALTSADRSRLSRLVADMHKMGLVSRKRPAGDQGSLQVGLTAPGRELYERIMPVASYFEQVATSDLSRKDAAALKPALDELYHNLKRIEAEIDSGDVQKLIKPKQGERAKKSLFGQGRCKTARGSSQ
jgi:DNA-binding MarR family transcriptional regulator